MKVQSVKKNFIYQLFYKIVIFIIPVIISPYLTRTLGKESLGIYTYTYSIAYYFVVACMLGILKYGQRIIATRRDDEISLRKTYWSLFLVHFIISIFVLMIYLIFLNLYGEYDKVFWAQLLFVLSAAFDITWLFYGLENFKVVVVRNFIIKFLSTVLIFIFVKSPSDLILYTYIMAGSTLLGNIIVVPTAIKIIKPIKFSLNDCLIHLKPMFILSIAVIASTLYTVFDKTLIGIIIDKESVAFYEYSHQIIMMPISIILVIGTVLYPKSCACFSKNDYEGMKKYFRIAVEFTYFIAFGAIVGLIFVSDMFVNLYYGSDFSPCSNIIKSMTPIIIVITLGDIFRTQYLIPLGKDIAYIVIAILNAIINVILSLVLLHTIGIQGAVIGTLSAELFGTCSQAYICRKYIDFKSLFSSSIIYIIAASLMGLFLYGLINWFNTYTWINLIIIISLSLFVYILLIFMMMISNKTKKNILLRFLRKNK